MTSAVDQIRIQANAKNNQSVISYLNDEIF